MSNRRAHNTPPAFLLDSNPESFGHGTMINQHYGISQPNSIPTYPYHTRSAAMTMANQNPMTPQAIPYPYHQSPVSQQHNSPVSALYPPGQLDLNLDQEFSLPSSNSNSIPANNSNQFVYPDQYLAYSEYQQSLETQEDHLGNTFNMFPTDCTNSNIIFDSVSPLHPQEPSGFSNPAFSSNSVSPLRSRHNSNFSNEVLPLKSSQYSTNSSQHSAIPNPILPSRQPSNSGAMMDLGVSTEIEVDSDRISDGSLPDEDDLFKEDEEDFNSKDELEMDQLSDQASAHPNEPPIHPETANLIPNPCRKLIITFNIWVLKFPPGKPPEAKGKNTGKQGKGGGSKIPKSLQPKWIDKKPRYAVKQSMNLHGHDWLTFRNQVFEYCDEAEKGVLPALKAAYRDRTLTIEGWINGSAEHKKNDKAVIKDKATFKEFVDAALAMPSDVKMGLRMVHPNNPKDDEDSNCHLYKVFNRHVQEPEQDSDQSEGKDEPEERTAADVDPVTQKYNLLMSKFENIFRSGENVGAAPNPTNLEEVLVLNTDRVRMWARDWDQGEDGVDEINPPMHRAGWEYVPSTSDRPEPNGSFQTHSAQIPQTINNYNYFGDQHLPHIPQAIPATPAFPPTTAPPPRDESPAPRPYPPFEHFLDWAGVTPNFTKAREVLKDQGIDDFGRLLDRDTYSLSNLNSIGIPFAQAADIFKAVLPYNRNLKKRPLQGGAIIQ
ncbi:uncharacterized protein MELLADRAFT_86043 [Melampsora larici-populina 98AG31]|uniref:Uncharacterized protein n=1 Tax=Melampsora larici-populina (strain 98AG31 / pathotype 3-4-7) TaxID=747676 RepID=F4RKJ7_MELLP|nr:uncharacterized protein MELLADRAFT_86043 [Melampsora larici-populina 98AG31]EGG07167.1 hypothetical protein MELLADRAFT_86043 [Melampsora larici-populina 98AG31]